jgi:predicted dehydrogenase
LGRIAAVNGQWNRRPSEPLGWPKNAPIDRAILKKYGYTSMEQFKNWRWYKGLGGGPMVDLGSHQVDIYNWFLDAKPQSVIASGRTNYYDPETHQWPDTVMAIYEYETAQGSTSAYYQTISSNGSDGYFEKFMGDQGTLIISETSNRGIIYPEPRKMDAENWMKCLKKGHLIASEEIMKAINTLTPAQFAASFGVNETLRLEQFSPNAPKKSGPFGLILPVKLDKPIHQPHLENFFDAIRGKAKLTCPAEIGYETAVAVLKVNETIEAGRKLEFKQREFNA